MDSESGPEGVKLTINGKVYTSLDEVPEPYRELVRKQLSAAQSAAQQAAAAAAGAQAGSPVRISKHFTINLKINRSGEPGTPALPPPSGDGSSGWRTALLLLALAGLAVALWLKTR